MTDEKRRRGLVHLYVGDGKGKTTASVGLAVRAAGCGEKVLFCQFMKGCPTGELKPLEALGVSVVRAPGVTKFVSMMEAGERERCKAGHIRCFEEIREAIRGGGFSLLVLDEAVDAVNAGLIPLEGVLELLKNRPSHLEVALTGRNPPRALSDAADYLTRFVCAKHPYQRGIAARQGIEY